MLLTEVLMSLTKILLLVKTCQAGTKGSSLLDVGDTSSGNRQRCGKKQRDPGGDRKSMAISLKGNWKPNIPSSLRGQYPGLARTLISHRACRIPENDAWLW